MARKMVTVHIWMKIHLSESKLSDVGIEYALKWSDDDDECDVETGDEDTDKGNVDDGIQQ